MSTADTIIKNEKNFSKSQKTIKTPNGSVFTNGFKTKTLETTQNQKQIKNLEEQFKAACDAIQNLPKNGPFQPSNEMLLKFYAYYKQATQGPCKTSRPGIFKVVERAKYDAWDSVRHLNKEQAMQGYIDEIKKIVETMPHNEFVQKLINIIGPFYEFVDEKNELIYPSEKENDDNDEEEEEDDKESVIENKNYIISNKNVTSTLINDDISNLKISDLETNGPIKYIDSNNQNISIDKIDTIHLKPLDESLSLNQNGHIYNGKKSFETQINGLSNNSNEITSDDDEDYCDTSDHINEQDILIKTLKKNHTQSSEELELLNKDYNHNTISSKLNGHDHPELNKNNSSFNRTNQDLEVKNFLINHKKYSNNEYSDDQHNKFSPIVHTYGGELNSPPGNIPTSSYQNRYSRPGSSQSMSYGQNRFNHGAGHSHNHGGGTNGGMGGGGSGSGNENFLVQDTNRQILLILLRLQQDTSNVLTRLSYLESSVLSLQSNRFENEIQMKNQPPSAFSVVASHQNRTSSNQSSPFGFLMDMFRNIDWKTVAIAIIWPFIIRLVFYFLKKVRLVIKFRRAK